MNKYIITVVINGVLLSTPALEYAIAEDTLRRIATDNPEYNARINIAERIARGFIRPEFKPMDSIAA